MRPRGENAEYDKLRDRYEAQGATLFAAQQAVLTEGLARDALAAELADWMRMRNEAMAVATSNRARIRELETENERLLSLCQTWSESCTGRHGSQTQCVTSMETSVDDEQALTDWADRIAGAAFTNDRGGVK
jgi:hypothetical protein